MNASYRPRADALEGRVILITGAGDGIGRSAALTYARFGATVILLGRTICKLEAVYDEIIAVPHVEPAIFPMDLAGATPADYGHMAQRIEESFGRLDGLLLNAGVLGELSPIEHYDPRDWLTVMQVNLNSPVFMVQACLYLLRFSNSGSIVLTTSQIGRRGRAHWGAYCASKFAIEGVAQILSQELENSTIRVNCVNPGPVRTRMRASAYPAENPRDLPVPEDIMGAYVYLMDPATAQTRGQSLDAWKGPMPTGGKNLQGQAQF